MTPGTCRNCAAPAPGAYCGACGQRQPRPDDFSLRRLAQDAREELTDTDSRFWRSLVGLFRPGELTAAYLDYQWQRYLPPLRMYLVFSGIFFLLAWGPYHDASVEQILAAPAAMVPAMIKQVYADPVASDRLSDLTALFKFLFVVPMGYWIALLHLGNRRPVGAHMVLSLQYTTMDFALFSAVAPLVAFAGDGQKAAVLNMLLLPCCGLLWLWTMLAIRRVYQRDWWASAWRGAAIVAMDLVLSSLAGQFALIIVLLRSL